MITIVKNQIMIEQYEEVLQVTSNEIKLRLPKRFLSIHGEELKVLALSQDEVLVEGKLEGLMFQYEK